MLAGGDGDGVRSKLEWLCIDSDWEYASFPDAEPAELNRKVSS